MRMDIHETPDIEAEADRFEDEQRTLAEDARYAGINSCDALRIIDGVIPDPTEAA